MINIPSKLQQANVLKDINVICDHIHPHLRYLLISFQTCIYDVRNIMFT